LYQWWRSFSENGGRTKGGRLRGIFPGYLNTSEGPDFRSAKFALDGTMYRGDVEIHIHPADWLRHGHHLDPKYDRVVLHLVSGKNGTSDLTIRNSRGDLIPTLSFSDFPSAHTRNRPDRCCTMRTPSEDILRTLSRERFVQRSRILAERISGNSCDQVLYRELLYLLGKPANSNPFLRLAEILPWDEISMIRKYYHLSADGWYYLLLRLSGLIKRDHRRPEERLLNHLPLKPDDWSKGGLRPVNRPEHRLYGLAHFISTLPGPAPRFLWYELTMERLPVQKAIRQLIQLHRTPGQKGWGTGQVLELVGNVILPHLYQEAHQMQSPGFTDYITELYFSLPSANRYACLRVFRPVCQGPRRFYKDQAFLEIYHRYCSSGSCSDCPVCRMQETD
jgi:hypothetical protein